MKALVIEELVDGWRVVSKGVVVAKFGSANLQKTLALQTFWGAKDSMMLDLDEVEALVYTDKAEDFIKSVNIPLQRKEKWQISRDFFSLKNSNLIAELEKVIQVWNSPQEVLLRAGEMGNDELRTSMAVLGGFGRSIKGVINDSIEKSKSEDKKKETPKELIIEGFCRYHTGGGCMSLNYFPEGEPDKSLYVMITDELSVPTSESEKIEVGLYTPEGECLFYEEFPFLNGDSEGIEVASKLAEISNNLWYVISDEPMMYDDMLTYKTNDDLNIQVSSHGNEYVFTSSFFEDDTITNGTTTSNILEAYNELQGYIETKNPSYR